MSYVTHTPGPWKVDFNDATTSIYSKEGVFITSCTHEGRYKAMHEANAKLIAAAPELLEALNELKSFHPTALPLAAFKIIEAAIKKATTP